MELSNGNQHSAGQPVSFGPGRVDERPQGSGVEDFAAPLPPAVQQAAISGGNRLQRKQIQASLNAVSKRLERWLNGRGGNRRAVRGLGAVFGREGGSLGSHALRHVQGLLKGQARIPKVVIVSQEELGQANGAYSATGKGTIFISDKLLNDPEKLEQVLLEELGHHIDARLGRGDSMGDEGALFADLIMGHPESALTRRTEARQVDHGEITVNGRKIQVEFSQDAATAPAAQANTVASPARTYQIDPTRLPASTEWMVVTEQAQRADASDPATFSLTSSLSSSDANFGVDASTGQIFFKGTASALGTANVSLTLTKTKSDGTTQTQQISIVVNTPPAFSATTPKEVSFSSLSGTIASVAVNNPTGVTYRLEGAPPEMSISNSGDISFSSPTRVGYVAGSRQINVVATDSKGGVSRHTLTLRYVPPGWATFGGPGFETRYVFNDNYQISPTPTPKDHIALGIDDYFDQLDARLALDPSMKSRVFEYFSGKAVSFKVAGSVHYKAIDTVHPPVRHKVSPWVSVDKIVRTTVPSTVTTYEQLREHLKTSFKAAIRAETIDMPTFQEGAGPGWSRASLNIALIELPSLSIFSDQSLPLADISLARGVE
ncbi:MAG: hypothetical protein WBB85_00935, partial [Albidovulum sp.]|uniref:hypothetical protein n=1 Tax=Albidovulum sp. TaxID=1872424 RepID=UPI003CA66F6A